MGDHPQQAPCDTDDWTAARLLAPISPDEFLRSRWMRDPVHVQRDSPGFYASLMEVADIEGLLSIDGFFERASVAMPMRGEGPPPSPPRCVSDVIARLHEGGSLRIRKLQEWLPSGSPVIRLLRDLEATLGQPADSLTCYLAARTAVGLGPHHDETEIFTLQITGSKRWRFYGAVNANVPGLHEPATLGPPSHQLVMSPGDFLYMPRGLIHDVTNTEASFSLTIVFDPPTWSVLSDVLADRLARSELFAQRIDGLAGDASAEALEEGLRQRIAEIKSIASALDTDSLLDELARRRVAACTGGEPVFRLSAFDSAAEIMASTILEVLPALWHLGVGAGRCRLTAAGGSVLEASDRVESALRDTLGRQAPFAVGDLHDSLSTEAKIALARQLVAHGLLRVANGRE
jgi:ribosomal protein L16 Arg81 hydroxylase